MARLVEVRVDPSPAEATPATAVPRAVRRPRPSKQVSLPLREPIAEPPVVAQQVEATQFDPGLIARYRLETIAAARRFKSYPSLARENGWQGRAEVRVSFGGAGAPALAVSRSSGYAVLDRQAVETLTSALPALPPLLLGRAFELDFPVVFSLED